MRSTSVVPFCLERPISSTREQNNNDAFGMEVVFVMEGFVLVT